MSRRNKAKKRIIIPDPLYNSRLVSMLTMRILKSGKKSLAQKIIYRSLDIIKEKTSIDPLEILEKAIRNATPLVEVKARRVKLIFKVMFFAACTGSSLLRPPPNLLSTACLALLPALVIIKSETSTAL